MRYAYFFHVTLTGEPTTPRRRSVRRSLRESFRRLRKRRIPLPAAVSSVLRRRAASPSATEPKPAAGEAAATEPQKPAEEVKIEQPAAATTPAAGTTEV